MSKSQANETFPPPTPRAAPGCRYGLLTIEDSHLNVDFRHGAKELVSGEAVTLARSDKRLKLRDSIEPRRVKVYCMRCRGRQEEQ